MPKKIINHTMVNADIAIKEQTELRESIGVIHIVKIKYELLLKKGTYLF